KRIISDLPITSITETGTFHGDTTDFFAQHFSGPIVTCEVKGRYFRESKDRLKEYTHIKPIRGSSVATLQGLAAKGLFGKLPLFFLDAHWYTYWPLWDELRVVARLPQSIVMIDDFRVPGREEFGYDSQIRGSTTIHAEW